MARARNIKPAIFKNEILGVADPLLTILFQSLWCLADREGRLEDRPLRIKAETFPYRDGLDVNGYLTELQRSGFIQRYSIGGVALIQVVNFKKHQTPHNTEKTSELPAPTEKILIPCGLTDITVTSPLKDGEKTDALPPDSLNLIPDSLVLIPEFNKSHDLLSTQAAPELDESPKAERLKTEFPDCPYEKLLALWAKQMPHLRQPRVWEGSRRQAMRMRWQQAAKPSSYSPDGYKTEVDGLRWWEDFLIYIANDTSLSNGFESQGRTWRPDLEWVCNAANFAKIIDGKYDK